MVKRKKTILAWTPFERATTLMRNGATIPAPDDEFIFINSRYQVNIRGLKVKEPFGRVLWLSIKRRNKDAIHDWRDLQRIKNELIGPEFEAIEIYPAESRLHDTANQYHLWVFADGYQMPIGFADRVVAEETIGGAVQRPFEDKPADSLSRDELKKLNIFVKLVGQEENNE